MKIGIICGKTSEKYLNTPFVKKIPKKYKINGENSHRCWFRLYD